MSGRRVAEALGADAGAAAASLSGRSPVSPRLLAGALAFVPIAAAAAYRVAHNAPGSLPGPFVELAALLLPFAVVGPAVAGLLLASVADRPVQRVGLAFAGGFGLVALAPSAWYPATAGVVCGGASAVGSLAAEAWRDDRSAPQSRPTPARYAAVAGVLVVAVLSSLAATAGVAPSTLRPLGSSAALLGVGLAPLLTGTDGSSLAAGVVAGGLAFAAVTSLPYVAGAVLLVGGGVVGAPVALVVLGVGGGTAALTATLRRGRYARACGAGLLLVAGVPATPPQALSVLLALVLLAPGGDAT
jgi:hypothetical protein